MNNDMPRPYRIGGRSGVRLGVQRRPEGLQEWPHNNKQAGCVPGLANQRVQLFQRSDVVAHDAVQVVADSRHNGFLDLGTDTICLNGDGATDPCDCIF